MAGLLMATALFASQAITSIPGPEPFLIQEKDAAYEALANGDTEQAIRTLEEGLLIEPNDPVLLINLGSAYARLGKSAQAAAAFQAALDSKAFYRVELSDGRWVDSRIAARRGLSRVERSGLLARADIGN